MTPCAFSVSPEKTLSASGVFDATSVTRCAVTITSSSSTTLAVPGGAVSAPSDPPAARPATSAPTPAVAHRPLIMLLTQCFHPDPPAVCCRGSGFDARVRCAASAGARVSRQTARDTIYWTYVLPKHERLA